VLTGERVGDPGVPAPRRPDAERVTLTVCRGCCCGTLSKHPDVDHAEHLARLRAALDQVARLRVSGCLGSCEHSNVIIVNPSPRGRAASGRPVWLEHVLDDDAIDGVMEWVRAGGPGVAAAGHVLDQRVFNLADGAVVVDLMAAGHASSAQSSR
jgi:hypothetical protein